jgi:tetratricopeptide (TPR) repeat protein
LTDTYSDPRGVRRACSIQELAAICAVPGSEVIRVVEIFRRPGRSFLTPLAEVPLESATIVDLSHESLMRCWTRLVTWTEEERESAVSYIRIAQAAAWYAESSGALWIDPQLETGLQWRRRTLPTAAWADRYDPNFARAMDFLDRSEKEREAERQKRRARRRAYFIATYVLAALLVVIGTLARLANKQKVSAVHNRMLAQTAVDESLSSVGAQESQETPDSPEVEDMRRQLLDKARVFYADFAQQNPSEEGPRAEIAGAHSRLGDIDRLMQMREDAVHEYNESILEFGKLAQEHRSNPEYQRAIAYAHNWLGETLRTWLEGPQKPTQYTAADAKKEYDTAISIQETLHQNTPANPIYQQELARSYYNRGILLYDGNSPDAEADFQRASALLQPLIGANQPTPQQSTGNPDPMQDLARVNNNLGTISMEKKDYAKAEGLFNQAILSLQALRQKDPINREYKTEMATYYNNLALALARQHQMAPAAKASDSAQALAEELAEPGPSVTDLRGRILELRTWINKQ